VVVRKPEALSARQIWAGGAELGRKIRPTEEGPTGIHRGGGGGGGGGGGRDLFLRSHLRGYTLWPAGGRATEVLVAGYVRRRGFGGGAIGKLRTVPDHLVRETPWRGAGAGVLGGLVRFAAWEWKAKGEQVGGEASNVDLKAANAHSC